AGLHGSLSSSWPRISGADVTVRLATCKPLGGHLESAAIASAICGASRGVMTGNASQRVYWTVRQAAHSDVLWVELSVAVAAIDVLRVVRGHGVAAEIDAEPVVGVDAVPGELVPGPAADVHPHGPVEGHHIVRHQRRAIAETVVEADAIGGVAEIGGTRGVG